MTTSIKNVSFRISDLSCPNCAAKMEQALPKQKGIVEAKISYATGKAMLTFKPDELSEDQMFEKVKGAS